MMKRLLILLVPFVFAACVPAGQEGSLSRNVSALAEEITMLQNTVTDLQSSVDDLTLKNDALMLDNAQSADTISELRTEVTYLNNELAMLKSIKTPPTPVSQPAPAPVHNTAQPEAAPKIVIIEDVQSIKDSMYNYALDLYYKGKHLDSIEQFNDFIAKFPKDDFAENAQYWIGENYYSMKNYSQAETEFRKVLSAYPKGRKTPDALLKIGYAQSYLSKTGDAKKTLNEVVSKYPKSEAAILAKKRLSQLN